MQFIYPIIEAEMTFIVGGAMSIICFVIGYYFEERLDVERLDKKGLIVWGKVKKEFVVERPKTQDDI
jgi:hypothetical protein